MVVTESASLLYSPLEEFPEFMELVALFVEELPERARTARRQCEAADWQALRRTAHQLKGAGGSYGFPAVSDAAGRLESELLQQAPEALVRQATDDLAEVLGRVRCRGNT